MRLFFGLMICVLLGAPGNAMDVKASQKAAIANQPGDVRGVIFSPDGKTLAVSSGQTIKLYDWQSGKELASIPGGLGASFSPDGQALAFPGQDEFNNDGLMVWDIAGAKKRVFIQDDNVISPVFSTNGSLLAGAVGGRIKLWDPAAGKEVAVVPSAHKCSITAVSFLRDSKQLISADARGGCALWDLTEAAPKKIAEFKRDNDENAINALSVSRDGSRAALVTAGGELVVLDTNGLRMLGAMAAHKQKMTVKGVAVAPEMPLAATACSGVDDIEIKLWDIRNIKPLYSFAGHAGGVNCAAFSPDGKWLATGSDDKSAKIWSVEILLKLATPPPPPPKKED